MPRIRMSYVTHMQMSHVTHASCGADDLPLSASRHTYECDVTHMNELCQIRMSHVTRTDESCHTHTNESCHACHVTHVNESRAAYESVILHIRMTHYD